MNIQIAKLLPLLTPEPPEAFATGRMAAVFDLDGTLTLGDTTLPWLRATIGRGATMAACAGALLRWLRPDADHRRTRFKRALLAAALAGVEVARARAAAATMAGDIGWRDEMVDTLQAHLDAGDHVVIATGAPRDLAEPLVTERFGPAPVILATELEVAGGRYTGRLAGPNNVRSDKAAALARWLNGRDRFRHVQGYGNAPDDLEMLALCDGSHIVQ